MRRKKGAVRPDLHFPCSLLVKMKGQEYNSSSIRCCPVLIVQSCRTALTVCDFEQRMYLNAVDLQRDQRLHCSYQNWRKGRRTWAGRGRARKLRYESKHHPQQRRRRRTGCCLARTLLAVKPKSSAFALAGAAQRRVLLAKVLSSWTDYGLNTFFLCFFSSKAQKTVYSDPF